MSKQGKKAAIIIEIDGKADIFDAIGQLRELFNSNTPEERQAELLVAARKVVKGIQPFTAPNLANYASGGLILDTVRALPGDEGKLVKHAFAGTANVELAKVQKRVGFLQQKAEKPAAKAKDPKSGPKSQPTPDPNSQRSNLSQLGFSDIAETLKITDPAAQSKRLCQIRANIQRATPGLYDPAARSFDLAKLHPNDQPRFVQLQKLIATAGAAKRAATNPTANAGQSNNAA